MSGPDESGVETAAMFATLSEQLNADWDAEVAPHAICERAIEAVPAARWCGITLRRRRGRLETVAVTDPVVEKWDALQYELDEGPCLESAQDEGSFVVRNVATDDRWPRWGPLVAELGVGSMVSIQMSTPEDGADGATLGAINLYADRVNAFTRADVDLALVYGVHASSALAAAQQISSLETAVKSRHLIGVAQGILMQRYGLSQSRAFELMQRYSSSATIKLREVADVVIQSRELPPLP